MRPSVALRGVVLVAVIGAAMGGLAHASPVETTVDALSGDTGDRRITFVGTLADRPDLAGLGLGTAGSWIPQFDTADAIRDAPTGDNARDDLPPWISAFNHTTHPADPGCAEPGALARGCRPTYYFRTFSQDGPARSAGGQPGWSPLRLPSGECGAAGAIVDPHTFTPAQEVDDPTGLVSPPSGEPEPNVNNTVNRLLLQGDVPATLFVSIVTDTTGRAHDPDRVELRGNAGSLDVPSEVRDGQVEATFPVAIELTANGVPDVHVFRVDGFVAGDYLKLRLRGARSAASFSGLLFDEAVEPGPAGAGRARRP